MILHHIKSGIEVDDHEFDTTFFPSSISNLSLSHFSPIEISKKAAKYLVTEPGTKVLDIGSGVGKFCMVGMACTQGHFYGIEQRIELYNLAKSIVKKKELPNIEYIHANVIDIDFKQFDAFYFYNSFFENLLQEDVLDDTIVLDKTLYKEYSEYVKAQLDQMPIGTRLATYFSAYDEIPDSYAIVLKEDPIKLTLWIKKF